MTAQNPSMEESAVDAAVASVAAAGQETVTDLQKLVPEAPDVDAPIKAGEAAVVNAMGQIAVGQQRIVQLVEGVSRAVDERLNAFSRSLAGTDISAQAAAEAAEAVKEIVQPEEAAAPEQGERPADIKELPKTGELTEKEARETWWFGKAARRHKTRR